MKITFVLEHADFAGGIRVVAIYADRLQRRGHQVQVVSTPRRPLGLRATARSLIKYRALPVRHPANGPSHLDAFPIDHKRTRRYGPVVDADVPDADVVIATWWETAEWVAALAPEKGAKAYLIQHHELLFGNQPKDRVASTWRSPLHKVVISKWLKDVAEQTYGDFDVSHVPNSVDTEQFFAPQRDRQESPTIGMLYSPTPFKGCQISFEAIRRVQKMIPNLRVVVFGTVAVRDDLRLPAGSTYTRLPAQDKIRDLYASCDVWLCGSRSEGFHLPPLEAMACRCPVVSTNVGGPADTIVEGVNGYLVEVDDVDALADRLQKVLSLSPDQWRLMSDAAYATATEYSWDDAAEKLESALQHAVAKSELCPA